MANERQYAQENFEYFKDKHLKDLENLNKKKTPQEKHPDVIEEPKPGPNHLFCAICREQFKDYIDHIFCSAHRTNVRQGQNSMIYSEIDKVILDVEKVTREKDREQQRLLMLRRRKMQQKDYLEQLSVNNPEEKLPKHMQSD